MSGRIKKIGIFSILGMFLLFPSGLVAQEGGESVQEVREVQEVTIQNCDSLRKQRKDLCRQAAKFCIEVHEYTAFNEIRSCAHFSQRCHQTGLQETDTCGDSQLTLNETE